MFEILIRFGDWKGRTLARYGGKFFNLQVDVFRRFIGCARRKYQVAFALARTLAFEAFFGRSMLLLGEKSGFIGHTCSWSMKSDERHAKLAVNNRARSVVAARSDDSARSRSRACNRVFGRACFASVLSPIRTRVPCTMYTYMHDASINHDGKGIEIRQHLRCPFLINPRSSRERDRKKF